LENVEQREAATAVSLFAFCEKLVVTVCSGRKRLNLHRGRTRNVALSDVDFRETTTHRVKNR